MPGVGYVVLWVLLTLRIVRHPRLFLADATDHVKGFAFLTTVAGTNVLGSASGIVMGWWGLAWALWWSSVSCTRSPEGSTDDGGDGGRPRFAAPAARRSPASSLGLDSHAAVAGGRVEARPEVGVRRDAFEHPAQEVEVHPTDELTLFLGEPMERAVRQGDLLGCADQGLVALLLEDGDDLGAVIGLACRLGGRAYVLADPAAGGMRDGSEAVTHRCTRAGRLGDRAREQRSGEVVVAIGYGRDHLVACGSVQLGRPSGTWPGASADPLERHLDDTGVRELVEVERRHRTRNPERRGGVVTSRPSGCVGEQSMELAAERLVQRGDGGDPAVEIRVRIHTTILKQSVLDETTPGVLSSYIFTFRKDR